MSGETIRLRCLYAEMLGGKALTLTIKTVRDAPKALYCNGNNTQAWDVICEQKDKDGNNLYIQLPHMDDDGKQTTILRQFIKATGGLPSETSAGKQLTLYSVSSKKAAAGEALRIKC